MRNSESSDRNPNRQRIHLYRQFLSIVCVVVLIMGCLPLWTFADGAVSAPDKNEYAAAEESTSKNTVDQDGARVSTADNTADQGETKTPTAGNTAGSEGIKASGAGQSAEGKMENLADGAAVSQDSDGLDTPTTDAETVSYGEAIYLDGQNGSDDNDGTSADKAVRTFEKAKQIAADHSGITTIYVTGTVPVSDNVSLDSTSAVLKRDPSFKGYLLEVSGTADLKNITIDGNGAAGTTGTSSPNVRAEKSLVHVTSSGSLTIDEGAVLQNNNASTSDTASNAYGGALHIEGGTAEMKAGTIQNNTAMWGGGVYVSDGATFTLSGGTITGNKALAGSDAAAGGGIATYNGANVNISGGSVENNISKDVGGGISMGTYRAGNESAKGLNKLTMTGGSISGNKSNGCGGGIYIANSANSTDYGYAEISAGNITNNKMLGGSVSKTNTYFGGGIYVNGSSQAGTHNGELHLTNVLITNNSASARRTRPTYTHSGGGIACCPSSQTILNINDGAAIYGNKSGYAHDIYVYSATDIGDHSGNPAYQISPFMLGGTAYQWKLENGEYASLSDLNGVNKTNHYELRLHTDVTNDEAAKNQAKVIISGNTSSTSGGGIGSDGTVVIGTPEGSETTELNIHKNWSVQDSLTIGDKIVVAVYRKHAGTNEKPVLIGNQYIKKTGKWSAKITNLPAKDKDGNPYEYSIGEVTVPGFTQDPKTGIFTADDGSGVKLVSEVTGNQTAGFTVTNRQVTSFSVQKNWNDQNDQDGKRPKFLTVHLMANGVQTGDPVKLTADNNWTYTWENLDAADADGNVIKYSVTEDNPAGYNQSSSTVTASGTSLTREAGSDENTINVHVTKEWPEGGTHPSSICIVLLADGNLVEGKTAILNTDNSWSADFKNLPAKKEDGTEIVYTVKETSAGGYTNAAILFETADVTVKASYGSSETKPDSVTAQILANGTAVEGRTAVLNEANGWEAVISGLPKHDASGNAISYTVEKVTDSGTEYDYHITATTSSTATVGDYLVIKQVNQWNTSNVGYIISRSDSAPAGSGSIDFQIIDSNGSVNSTMTLNAENRWSYTSGTSIPDGWSLRVSSVDGYQIGGTMAASDQNVTLVNTHTPEKITINGTKIWDDDGNRRGGRPDSITIHLWKRVGDDEPVEVKTIHVTGNSTDNGKNVQNGTSQADAGTVNAMQVDGKADAGTVNATQVDASKADAGTIDAGKDNATNDDVNKDDAHNGDANKWTFTFTDLPKYENSRLITYTITEDQVSGYNAPVITGDAENGFTVTNTSGYVLPATGGPGTAGYKIWGILLIAAAMCMGIVMKKTRGQD